MLERRPRGDLHRGESSEHRVDYHRGMGRAGPPGAAEHITTARGDRTDGHFDLVHHSLRQRPACKETETDLVRD